MPAERRSCPGTGLLWWCTLSYFAIVAIERCSNAFEHWFMKDSYPLFGDEDHDPNLMAFNLPLPCCLSLCADQGSIATPPPRPRAQHQQRIQQQSLLFLLQQLAQLRQHFQQILPLS